MGSNHKQVINGKSLQNLYNNIDPDIQKSFKTNPNLLSGNDDSENMDSSKQGDPFMGKRNLSQTQQTAPAAASGQKKK